MSGSPLGRAADLGPPFRQVSLQARWPDASEWGQRVLYCVPDGVYLWAKEARPAPGPDVEMKTSPPPWLWADPEGCRDRVWSIWKLDEVGGALSMCLALEEPRAGKEPSG